MPRKGRQAPPGVGELRTSVTVVLFRLRRNRALAAMAVLFGISLRAVSGTIATLEGRIEAANDEHVPTLLDIQALPVASSPAPEAPGGPTFSAQCCALPRSEASDTASQPSPTRRATRRGCPSRWPARPIATEPGSISHRRLCHHRPGSCRGRTPRQRVFHSGQGIYRSTPRPKCSAT
jgi:hypothetical protein